MPAFKPEQYDCAGGTVGVLGPRVQPHGSRLFLSLFFTASLVGKFKAEWGKEQDGLTNGSHFVNFGAWDVPGRL